MTDTTEGTEVEETFEANEQGVAYSSESAPSADAPARPATIAPANATGRRKEAVARVRLVPGTGKWTVNGRTWTRYFPNKLHQQVVNEPFVNTRPRRPLRRRSPASTVAASPARPARCASAWPAALNAIDVEANRPSLKKAGLLTRDARVIERKKAGLKKAKFITYPPNIFCARISACIGAPVPFDRALGLTIALLQLPA